MDPPIGSLSFFCLTNPLMRKTREKQASWKAHLKNVTPNKAFFFKQNSSIVFLRHNKKTLF